MDVMPTPKVYVVEDDTSLRRSLARLIRSRGFDVEVFDAPRAFLECTPIARPGCLILDVRLPGLSGLELQDRLGDAAVFLPIVFMTGYGDVPMSVRAMKAGAVDFITKPFDERDLLRAIDSAIEQSRRTLLQLGEVSRTERRFANLTHRQREVMERVIAGRLNKQIAGELGISEKTVKVHRHQVMEKVGVRSVAELVRLAEKAGIASGASGRPQ